MIKSINDKAAIKGLGSNFNDNEFNRDAIINLMRQIRLRGSGTGKTHLAIAIAQKCVRSEYNTNSHL